MSDRHAPMTLVIPGAFNGPPASAHGGYVCGRLAALAARHLDGPVRVALHLPVPLETPLEYETSERRGYASAGGEIVATVARAQRAVPLVERVPPATATAAQAAFAGRSGHPFPTCFVCGTDGPGLRLAPGPVPGRSGTAACVWTPDPASGTVPPEIVWSALDCPGGWTCDLVARPRVLASMTARVDALPRPGHDHVIVARLVDVAGRNATTATTLYDADGAPLARAFAQWVTLAA